jgi:hypothetical protein
MPSSRTRRPIRGLPLILPALTLLVACAGPTGYEPSSIWNDGYGWSDKPAGPDEFSVVVRANSHTSPERAARIAVLRAARLTLEQGCERFVVIDQESAQRRQEQFTSAPVTSGGQTLFVPLEPRTTQEAVAVLLIALVRPGAPPVEGEVDAAALEAELAPGLD